MLRASVLAIEHCLVHDSLKVSKGEQDEVDCDKSCQNKDRLHPKDYLEAEFIGAAKDLTILDKVEDRQEEKADPTEDEGEHDKGPVLRMILVLGDLLDHG